MTQLMIAVVDNTRLEFQDEDDEDGTNTIVELVKQGADLHAKMDKTGETPLHLAARLVSGALGCGDCYSVNKILPSLFFLFLRRYSRADAAKCLLDLHANPNAKDNTGRTPLHAAVAADAIGVFQVIHWRLVWDRFRLRGALRPPLQW